MEICFAKHLHRSHAGKGATFFSPQQQLEIRTELVKHSLALRRIRSLWALPIPKFQYWLGLLSPLSVSWLQRSDSMYHRLSFFVVLHACLFEVPVPKARVRERARNIHQAFLYETYSGCQFDVTQLTFDLI
jgi:hypothetical protein